MSKIREEIIEIKNMLQDLINQRNNQEIDWIDKHQAAALLGCSVRYLMDHRDSLKITWTRGLKMILFSRLDCKNYLLQNMKKYQPDVPEKDSKLAENSNHRR